jgi:hypothetical protein
MTTHQRLVKHDAGWRLKRRPDGAIPWTRPTDHVYLVPAATFPIDTTWQHTGTPAETEHPATDTDAGPPTAA